MLGEGWSIRMDKAPAYGGEPFAEDRVRLIEDTHAYLPSMLVFSCKKSSRLAAQSMIPSA